MVTSCTESVETNVILWMFGNILRKFKNFDEKFDKIIGKIR